MTPTDFAEDTRLTELLSLLESVPSVPAAELGSENRTQQLAVLDTNVVLDVWYWHDRHARALAEALAAGHIRAVSSSSCLKELAVVLTRPQFRLSFDAQDDLLRKVLSCTSVAAVCLKGSVRCRDADDEKFLSLALELNADYLFSKDKAVLKAGRRLAAFGIKTLRPADFSGPCEKQS